MVDLLLQVVRETWFILKEKQSTAAIPLISSEKPAFIVSGRLENDEPAKYYTYYEIDTDKKFLHYIWPVEFHDLDGDKTPEIWMRYNFLLYSRKTKGIFVIERIREENLSK